ncbi:glutamate dehydrogenase (NAD/NADP) [Candidatus Vecturithrix granuli]|uniref:Glutamate dehydrogenase n=1 Tax=Vecturithrix granuli TaxID=1499967 RepID=A0A081C403_VECG1|nr:glutamate dehydrogenase (NAD/NADP) [Candidatus Vecturithrix granuli]
MAENIFNAFKMAQQQFDEIAEQLNLDQGTRELLRHPLREYHFSIPVKMDHGMTRIFRGMRIQHNDACGPSIGGIRFQPQESVNTIRALAAWTTWTCALMDLPMGGAAGTIVCNPHNLSLLEQEQICRGWVRQLARNLGPLRDVPSPDVMTNDRHTFWMLDEYEVLHGAQSTGFSTGKPFESGRSRGSKEAPGYGLVITIREALKEMQIDPNTTTASVQGFGTVAQPVVESYHQLGGKVTAVACWDHKVLTSYTFRKPEGIDGKELQKMTDQFGSINLKRAREFGYEVLPGDVWLEQDVDILIPAALENQISVDNVGRISEQVKLIAEGAYGATTPEADRELAQRHITLIPDLLCNAGGVISSYFEQVQSNMNCYWAYDEVLAQLESKMTAVFGTVSELARKKTLSLRHAAYIMAIDRIVQSCKARGWV